MDNLVILLVWILTVWSFVSPDSSQDSARENNQNEEDVPKRMFIALTIFLMLLNLLIYLSCYSFIGAVLYIFMEVVIDFMPIFVVMGLFLIAYVVALRMVLYGGESETDPFEADSSESDSFHFMRMINIAFNFGFIGTIDESYLEPYDETDRHRLPLNILSEVLYYMYAIVSNVILLNLLIAVMGDSFDRVKEVEQFQRRLLRARALLDMERTWGNLLQHRFDHRCFPNCLHVLTRKGGLNENQADEMWVGKVMEIRKHNKENLQNFQGEMEDLLRREIGGGLQYIDENMKSQVKVMDANLKARMKYTSQSIEGTMEAYMNSFNARLRTLEDKLDKMDMVHVT